MRGRTSRWFGLACLCACADPQPADELGASETAAVPDLPSDSDSETDSGTDSGTETETSTETGEDCPPFPCDACVCVDGVLDCACRPEPAEAGFVELAGVDYELGLAPGVTAQSSTATRMFWTFQPADVEAIEPDDAPVFVLFNGGPGVSSGMLLGLNTGRASFDPSRTGPDQPVVANPHAWTGLGHLLWIDARQTGFSYGLLDDPSDLAARQAAMKLGSFNAYRDAGDFVHVLLAFLAAHPQLRDNPVILVGESYGGIRAQVMLDMLLHPQAYADGSRKLRDLELVEVIQAHHAAVLGQPDPGPEVIAAQFGRQILIQPALTGEVQQLRAGELFEQPGSIVEQLAVELGVDYPSCAELGGACNPYQNALGFVADHGRSGYDLRAPSSWLDDLLDLVAARLNDASATASLLGLDRQAIAGLAASERTSGWRAINLDPYPTDAELGDWPALIGALEPWDRYFMPFNGEALNLFRSYTARTLELDPADAHFGELFLTNLIWVDTLITDAAYDIVVYTPGIAEALRDYVGWVSAVVVDPDAQEWLIEYAPELGVGARTITVPRYESSHAVSLDEPAQLRADIEAWVSFPP